MSAANPTPASGFGRSLFRAYFRHDFADGNGSATGGVYNAEAVTPSECDVIPDNAVIVGGFIDVATAVDDVDADGDVTLAVHVEAANDIVAAVAVSSGFVAGVRGVIPDMTAANAVKTTAARRPTLTVGAQDVDPGGLDTGVVSGHLLYFVSE